MHEIIGKSHLLIFLHTECDGRSRINFIYPITVNPHNGSQCFPCVKSWFNQDYGPIAIVGLQCSLRGAHRYIMLARGDVREDNKLTPGTESFMCLPRGLER